MEDPDHMRMTLATLVPALCAALSMAAAGGPPPEYRFEADARDTSVADVALRSGDSADLVWRLRGADGAPWEARAAEAAYQTNGMPDNLWWPAPASCASNEVRVSWTPSLDPGADSVFMLVRVRGCAWRCATRIRIARGPGERPNELRPPVPSIDFAAVAVTNAPWALPADVDGDVAAATNAVMVLARADIAAATNAIPRPDMGAYATTGMVAGALAAKRDLDDLDMPFTTAYPFNIRYWTVGPWRFDWDGAAWDGGRDVGFVWGEYADGVWRFEYRLYDTQMVFLAWEGFDASVGGIRCTAHCDRLARVSELVLATNRLARAVSPVYADPAPWSTSVVLLAPAGYADTYAVTNGDTAAEYMRSGTYADARCSVVVEDRPAEYAYEAPTGTWSIVSDPAGAASGISPDGYLSSSRTNSGSVVVEYATPSNGSRRAAVWLSQSAADRRIRGGLEVPGTFRHTCGTNILAKFAAVDYAGPRHSYSCGKSIPDALAPYDGFSANPPSGANPSFFWPEAMPALLCVSIGRSDLGGIRSQKLLAISPHFAVAAKHFGEVPPSAWSEYFCTNYSPFARMKVTCLNPRIGNPANDLALVRFREALPTNCIARLVRASDAESLSPSLFKGAVGINLTQHNTLAPVHVRDAFNPWAFEEHPAATNAVHAPLHVGDSGTPCGILTPGLKYIPLFSVHTADCAGPSLLDAGNQAWIEARLAEYGESPAYWNLEDLR